MAGFLFLYLTIRFEMPVDDDAQDSSEEAPDRDKHLCVEPSCDSEGGEDRDPEQIEYPVARDEETPADDDKIESSNDK